MRFASAFTLTIVAAISAHAQEDCDVADTTVYFPTITHRGLKSDGSMYHQSYKGAGKNSFTAGTFPEPPETCGLASDAPPLEEPSPTAPTPTAPTPSAPTPTAPTPTAPTPAAPTCTGADCDTENDGGGTPPLGGEEPTASTPTAPTPTAPTPTAPTPTAPTPTAPTPTAPTPTAPTPTAPTPAAQACTGMKGDLIVCHEASNDKNGDPNVKYALCHVPPGNDEKAIQLCLPYGAADETDEKKMGIDAHLKNHANDFLGCCCSAGLEMKTNNPNYCENGVVVAPTAPTPTAAAPTAPTPTAAAPTAPTPTAAAPTAPTPTAAAAPTAPTPTAAAPTAPTPTAAAPTAPTPTAAAPTAPTPTAATPTAPTPTAATPTAPTPTAPTPLLPMKTTTDYCPNIASMHTITPYPADTATFPLTIDGSINDWTQNGLYALDSSNPLFLQNMWRAGNPTKDVLSYLFGKMDTATKKMYILVLSTGLLFDSVTDTGNYWVKYDSVLGVDSSARPSAEFKFILNTAGKGIAYEGAWDVSAVCNTCLSKAEIHANVDGETTSTGKNNQAGPSPPTNINIVCPAAPVPAVTVLPSLLAPAPTVTASATVSAPIPKPTMKPTGKR